MSNQRKPAIIYGFDIKEPACRFLNKEIKLGGRKLGRIKRNGCSAHAPQPGYAPPPRPPLPPGNWKSGFEFKRRSSRRGCGGPTGRRFGIGA